MELDSEHKFCDGQTENFPTDCYSPHPLWRIGPIKGQSYLDFRVKDQPP